MDWYNKQGLSMSLEDWDSPAERTLQYLAASTPEFEEFNRILLVVHGLETDGDGHAARARGRRRLHAAVGFVARRPRRPRARSTLPGEELVLGPTSMRLFRAH